jgi:hypothetical protein
MSHNEKESPRPLTWRNYRPELNPAHLRQHTAFFADPATFDRLQRFMERTDARHRLAFLAAAAVQNALFLDLHQVPDPIPVPDSNQKWGAILNDDEPGRGGSRGPTFFHEASLIRLVSRAAAITLNSSGPDGATYAIASSPLGKAGDNCLLVETTTTHAPAWRDFIIRHRVNAPMAVVTGHLEGLH